MLFLVEGREFRKVKKGVVAVWRLGWVFRADILAGRDLLITRWRTNGCKKSEVERSFQKVSELCTRREIRRQNWEEKETGVGPTGRRAWLGGGGGDVEKAGLRGGSVLTRCTQSRWLFLLEWDGKCSKLRLLREYYWWLKWREDTDIL